MTAPKKAPARGRWASRVETTAVALDGRVPFLDAAKGLIRKVFPDHWSFLLGELALYSFVVLLLTGVYLTLFFNPSMGETVYQGSYLPLRGIRMTEAYASTLHISFDVRGGLLIRQVHHWAALVFVAAIAVHMLRIFFTGAFRRPRELNWVLGVTLLLLAMVEGFCGYSLPDDLISGTGLRITQGIMLSIPLVGTYLTLFAFGGEYPGRDIVARLYELHILLVPGLLLALIGAHLTLVFSLKHTHWAGRGRTNRNVVGMPMFPQFLTRTLGLLFAVFGVLTLLGGLGQINPIWVYGPYRPDAASIGSQPDWYMGFLEGSLRLMPALETRALGHTIAWGALVPAVLLPGAIFTALYLYPFAERWLTRSRGEHHLCDRPRNQPTRTGLGVAGTAFYAVLLVAGGDDVIAYSFGISLNALVWTLRGALIVLPLLGFVVTKRLCLALQAHDRERLLEGEETGAVVQSVEGGYVERNRRGLTADQRYVLLVREAPEPLLRPAEEGTAVPRSARLLYQVQRMRVALSVWFHEDRLEMPATDAQRRQIAAVLAPAAHPKEHDGQSPTTATTGAELQQEDS
ncbi:cytochrome bc complex cytochrome b subunit [Kitasatospora aureofaciens]|uniref:cytochrome bc1 complex cytochrome b subunit n=1 Tax=Kitasatospora aureofaciens TaxID=1894 RepID=UPI001C4629CF|nr:cytochrome bc complex cytochrome b subunit [Kitasatospora aureofaciens]MBV6702696.1 cytochrome bc complex cytochrome b subunit [Kitasatospora aureofaciens]